MFFLIVILLEMLYVCNRVDALVELPYVNYQDPSTNDSAIRETTKKLLSTFDQNEPKDSQRINDYFKMHDYMLSLTSKDYEKMKEIAEFTKYNNKIDNVTANFIAALNDLIREDMRKFNNQENTVVLDANLRSQVDTFLNKIKKLKEKYVAYESYTNMNEEVLKYINSRESESSLQAEENASTPVTANNFTENDIEVWASSGRRIYKGKRTKIKHYPFMAGVLILNSFTCAGSIIKSDLIITATSCIQLAWNNRFFRENPAFLSVRVGSSFYNAGGEVIPVLEIYFHPTYNPKTLKDNISLLRLTRRLHFSKSKRNRIKRIEIDRRPSPVPFNTPGITVVGWGAKTRSNTLHDPWKNILSFAVIDVYDREDCQDIYSKEYVTRKNFCAGFISKGGGACNRDIGGPGLSDSLLIGVVSFGSPVCGAPDTPTVFTKIGYYADWIDEIMAQNVPHAKKRTTTTEKPYDRYYIPFGSTKEVTMMYPILSEVTRPSATDMNIFLKKRLRIEDKDEAVDEEQPFNNFLKTVFSSEHLKDYDKAIVKDKKMVTVMDTVDSVQTTHESQEFSEEKKDVDVHIAEKIEYENNVDTLRDIESVAETEGLRKPTREVETNNLSGTNEENTVESLPEIADDDSVESNVDVGIAIEPSVEQKPNQVSLHEGMSYTSDYEDSFVTNKPIETITTKMKDMLTKKKLKKKRIHATRENIVMENIINTLVDDVIANKDNVIDLNVNNTNSTSSLISLVKNKDKRKLKMTKNDALKMVKPGDINNFVFTMLYVASNETLDNEASVSKINEDDKEKKENQILGETEKTIDLTYRNARDSSDEEDIWNYILSY